MAIDQATLDSYINEVAGDDVELAGSLRERLGKNQNAATKFVNGFLGRADVTKKQQEVADQRRQMEQLQNNYEQRLVQADTEKQQIMSDLASERISAATAKSMLDTVKQAYGLTNRDLPGIEDIRQTAATGQVVDNSVSIDDRLAKFEKKLMKQINDTLIPEVSAMAIIPPIWSDIAYEHERLTGQRLTRKDQAEILTDARKSNRSLDEVWAEKFQISDKRLDYRDQENKKKWQQEWNDDRAKRDQELALRGVRPEAQQYDLSEQMSPIFKRSFMPKPDETPAAEERAPASASIGQQVGGAGGAQNGPFAGPHSSDAQRERLSGAERAAMRWRERAASGMIGKPLSTEKRTA